MKLLFCTECGDIFNMSNVLKGCACGKSAGRYLLDNLTVEVMGACDVICINNRDFYEALENKERNFVRCWVMKDKDVRLKRVETIKVGRKKVV